MSRNYQASTRARIADLIAGMRVETTVLANLTYLHQDQWEAFTVIGRIMVLQLYMEAITVNGAGATLFAYNYTSTTPAAGPTVLGLPSLSIAALAQGMRVTWTGGTVGGSNHILSPVEGISDLISGDPAILGASGMIGSIGFVTTVADAVSGTHQHVLQYIPVSDGAYAEANL